MLKLSICLCSILLSHFAVAAPAASSAVSSAVVSASTAVSVSVESKTTKTTTAPSTGTLSAPSSLATVPKISLDPNEPLWAITDGSNHEGVRGSLGASVIGPKNPLVDEQNPDLLAPPSTDHGSVQNAKWPFSLSHNRLQTGGWARNQNVGVMPIAEAMASVNMRLEAGAVRELHWHKTSEWAYVLKGEVQITSVDAGGRNYISTVGPGDLWYFPPGVPHSLQATNDDADGAEFILVFDSGAFSEDSTFLLTDWLNHVPAEGKWKHVDFTHVLAKNFQSNLTDLANIPDEELYIFPARLPEPDSAAPVSPQGKVPDPFSFALSKVPATKLAGGSVRVVDSTTFKISKTIAAAEVTVEPGAIRELHWHPTQDEWSFFLEGQGRVTIFASQSNARTFNYQAGDIGYVPATFGHYVENTGNTTLKFLEIFNTEKFEDISLNQWLALTPPKLVQDHLGLSDNVIAKLPKKKPTVVGPAQ